VGEDEVAAQSVGINLTAAKVSAFGIGGAIAGIAGAVFAHYTTHIEHGNFTILLATFAIAYPILGGLSSLFGTLLAVVFIQGVLIEALRPLGDWRSMLFGALILLMMLLRPSGMLTSPLGQLLRGKSGAQADSASGAAAADKEKAHA
jgi:branched-chain amino acid transport system permease protein